MNKKPLKERVLELTAVFETDERPPKCYGSVSGNHDGMGISFGVQQFNFRRDSKLQPMLKTLITDHRDIMENIFGRI
jgi:hypothetical protein